MSLSKKQIGNKEVLVVDCANMDSSNTNELRKTLTKATDIMTSKSPESVYLITDVTNLKFNTDITNAYKEYAKINTPYVKKSVIVGLSGMQNVIFNGIKKLVGGDYELVDTIKDAESYLLSI